MSQRIRSVSWIEGRILEVLSKAKPNNLSSPLALSAMVMKFEIRNLEEQHNYDLALYNLLQKKLIVQARDERGFQVIKAA